MSGYEDVRAFHVKFGVPCDEDVDGPFLPSADTMLYRAAFLEEELQELRVANATGDLPQALDALIDLVYVAYGTALLMGVSPACWAEAWADVQRANMAKERATSATDPRSKRSHSLDVVKPAGWTPPDHAPTLKKYGAVLPSADRRTLTDGSPVPADNSHTEINPKTGMQRGYVVLSEEERAKGFVRPLRRSYVHTPCGSVTTMSLEICETYAREPTFYGGTFCVKCRAHFPLRQFLWSEDGQTVGS